MAVASSVLDVYQYSLYPKLPFGIVAYTFFAFLGTTFPETAVYESPIAQGLEYSTGIGKVVGSIPAWGRIFPNISSSCTSYIYLILYSLGGWLASKW